MTGRESRTTDQDRSMSEQERRMTGRDHRVTEPRAA